MSSSDLTRIARGNLYLGSLIIMTQFSAIDTSPLSKEIPFRVQYCDRKITDF